jgi:hypothetical protein
VRVGYSKVGWVYILAWKGCLRYLRCRILSSIVQLVSTLAELDLRLSGKEEIAGVHGCVWTGEVCAGFVLLEVAFRCIG